MSERLRTWKVTGCFIMKSRNGGALACSGCDRLGQTQASP